jgi:HEAT repeat protein
LRNSDNDSLERVRQELPGSRIASFLKSSNPSAVKTAINLLGRYADSTIAPELALLYKQSNERLFEDLEKSILNIKPTDIKPFIDILNDHHEPVTVKVHVAQLLGKIADGSAFESLYSFANNESDELKIEIIRTLSAIDMQRSLPILHHMIQYNEQNIKAELIEIIKTLQDPSSVIILLGLSTDPSPSVRSAAAASLGAYDLNRFIPEIDALLKSLDNMEVIFALEAIHGELLGQFRERILSSCVDQNGTIRKIAVGKAGLLRDDQGFQTLVKSLSDSDSRVRLAAIRALENYQDRNLGDWLIVAALSDPEDWNRYEAAKMIGKIKAITVAPKLVASLDNAPDLVKVAILEVLGDLRLKEYTDLVRKFTHSESAPVSEAAIEATPA